MAVWQAQRVRPKAKGRGGVGNWEALRACPHLCGQPVVHAGRDQTYTLILTPLLPGLPGQSAAGRDLAQHGRIPIARSAELSPIE